MQSTQPPSSYLPPAGVYDEAVDQRGQLRPGWSALLSRVVDGSGGLPRLRHQAARLLDESGARHLFPHASSAPPRPWELDPVPLLIQAAEWRQVASGVAQRARLLNAVAEDAYGANTLMATGTVPAKVILGHASFAWTGPVDGPPPSGPPIVMYGVDLVRTASGDWRVLRDVTDAPSGAGYSLLNRAISSRLIPDAFRDVGVTPLSDFPTAMRGALSRLAPIDRPNPRTIVMSPGIAHPSYLEHSYLASALGYHLAELGDLLVRDRRLWLRTLGGLEQIDSVLRRSDDHATDPLDLGGVSGVPGLAHLSRTGGVGMANAIGTGFAGSFALHPFLGAACQHLLGTELDLAALDSLWCGVPESLKQVVDSLHRYVIHDVSPLNPIPTVFGDRLDERSRSLWRERLIADPTRFVAQEMIELATTPVADGARLRPGAVMLRVVALLDGETCTVLPGGLARVLSPAEPFVRQHDGLAKDVWVVGDSTVHPSSRSSVRIDVPQVDLQTSLPTRSAEALFWVGRSLEQADSIARQCHVVLVQLLHDPALASDHEVGLPDLVRSMLAGGVGHPLIIGPHESGDEIVAAAVSAIGDVGGLISRLAALRQAVGSVRQFVSDTSWRVLGDLDDAARELVSAPSDAAVLAQLVGGTIVDMSAFMGLIADSMVRGPSWRMLDLGRRIERSLVVLNTLESLVAPGGSGASEQHALGLFLGANDSLIAYRRRFRSDVELGAVLDLLISDATNPRSLAFQFARIQEDLGSLPARTGSPRLAQLLDQATKAAAARRNWDELDAHVTDGRIGAVDDLVVDCRGPLLDMVDILNQDWFADRRSMRIRGPQ
jgi:uncharacterized circularly permuted ATP-grasp superfamily protein/uncharacterized alpha-E superfamily protein